MKLSNENTLLEVKIIAQWALQQITYYRIKHSKLEDRAIETIQTEAKRMEELKNIFFFCCRKI